MSSTETTLPWPSRRDQILVLTGDLMTHLDVIDLDELDGEFYWRICRGEVFRSLSELTFEIAPRAAEGRTRIEQVYADLVLNAEQSELGRAQAWAFGSYVFHLRDQVPDFVFQRLLEGGRVPIREPISSVESFDDVGVNARVFSQRVSGDDLEQRITHHVDHGIAFPGGRTMKRLRRQEATRSDTVSTSTVSLAIDFTFVTEPLLPFVPLGYGPIQLPFIHVAVRGPLPPAGVVGREYDAIVRGQLQWHLELPGPASRQEKTTAVWTWAIGLLMAAGEDFYRARWDVEAQMNLPPENREPRRRQWFEKSRARLIERVPEAERHLYVRGKRSKPKKNP